VVGAPVENTAVAETPISITSTDTTQAALAEASPTGPDGLLKPTLTVRSDPQQRPLVAWSESFGATHYLLQESDSDTFVQCQEYRVKAPKTHWEPPTWGWRRAEKLYYRVRALNTKDAGPWSNMAIVELA
jgi:hypothetical protein